MEDYKPNSHRFKEQEKNLPEEKKKVEKVVTGKVRTKKKNEVRKFADVFIAEDVNNVKSYILMDVLVPAIKNTILDIITDSATMIFGGSKRDKKRHSSSNVSYQKYYDRHDDRRSSIDTRGSRSFDLDELIFDTRGEAEAVRDQMDEMIDRYGVVTVADLYDMVDITAPYTSNKYGWTNIRNVDVVRVRDGYILKLPRALAID